MIQPFVQLISDTDSLILDATAGWGITSLDLGDPETRSNMQNAPSADGALDFTEFIGARTITLGLELVEVGFTMWNMLARIRSFQHPRKSVQFLFQMDNVSPLVKVDVRRISWAGSINSVYVQNPILQWTAPKGVFEAYNPTITNIFPGTGGVDAGRVYNLTFDRAYPPAPISGSGTVTNLGNMDAYPFLRVYGPCTDPVIYHLTSGQRLAFVGLTINAGEFLEIDTRYRTIRYLGDPADSRYNKVNFAISNWFELVDGINNLRFVPATFSPGSLLEVTHYNTYL